MNTDKNNKAMCFLPGREEVMTFSPEFIELFGKVEDYWMKRRGMVVYPFDRNKPAYFFAADKAQNEATEFDLSTNEELSNEEYETSIFIAQQMIKSGEIHKVVLARNKLMDKTSAPEQVFQNAVEKFPGSYCYYADLGPEIWIGASPELLAEYENGVFKTMALAGTRDIDDQFTEKEQEEHKLVEQFIEEKLNELGLPDFKKSPKEEVHQAGIKHLRTGYEVRADPERALELLKHLHPTSAVCGMPRDRSFGFIRDFETLNRSFYAGIIGVLEEQKATFFVNLRCMRFIEDKVELFAGAGITGESRASDEWKETEKKIDVIRGLFQVKA